MADSTRTTWALLLSIVAAAIAGACAGTHGGSPGGSAGGVAGVAGSGGSAGGSAGGLDAGGSAGSGWSWGGASSGGASDGGVICNLGGFWPCTYDPACPPSSSAPADHDAYRTADCRTCHGPSPDAGTLDAAAADASDASVADAGSDASSTDAAGAEGGAPLQFLFGGFIWDPYSPTGAPKIQVGVRDGTVFYHTCSDARGFFYIPASAGPEPDWSKADSHIRSAIGEKIMPADKPHGPGCNSAPGCHGDPQHHMFAPL